jgi:hypothetical protein
MTTPIYNDFRLPSSHEIAPVLLIGGDFILQPICFRDRSSGFACGYTRSLKTMLVSWWHDETKMVLIHGYSFCITSSDKLDLPPAIRPGDSGSWIWEGERGRPVAQVTWGNGFDGMGVPLEGLFDEIHAMTGHVPSLP